MRARSAGVLSFGWAPARIGLMHVHDETRRAANALASRPALFLAPVPFS
jgi:hypothetical protein